MRRSRTTSGDGGASSSDLPSRFPLSLPGPQGHIRVGRQVVPEWRDRIAQELTADRIAAGQQLLRHRHVVHGAQPAVAVDADVRIFQVPPQISMSPGLFFVPLGPLSISGLVTAARGWGCGRDELFSLGRTAPTETSNSPTQSRARGSGETRPNAEPNNAVAPLRPGASPIRLFALSSRSRVALLEITSTD
jgi:hypothetical protein